MKADIERISDMEAILDRATELMDGVDKAVEEYEAYQSEISKLESYYTGQQWKDDYAADEECRLPSDLKRGVLSEDGVYNMLERNRDMLKMVRRIPEDDW